MSTYTQSRFSRAVDSIEESLIALLLGTMTLITFANVIARYIFDSNILWALEATVFLFAWLVLLGASYAVKHSIHIGVDIIVHALSPGPRIVLTLIGTLACVVFAVLLLKGSWDYWYPFVTTRAFLETEDIPMPDFLQFLAVWLNDGEKYEKIPRFIPYAVLPISMALLTFRFLHTAWRVLTGQQEHLLANHEVEDMIEEAAQSDLSNNQKSKG
ncbi:MAG: TRAP transporter small permease [bacterium]|nr:TRAP transporter small permease [bacterium]